MRGLAFPSNVAFVRETSNDYGSPYLNGDNIPIDPALGGQVIDPAILGESSVNIMHVQSFGHIQLQHSTQPPQIYSPPRQYSQEPRQYSQGPQGDPFAPQPLPPYLPVQDVPSPPPKPIKRKRRPRREEECGFCQGNDTKNKAGEPELMVTCDECGRSGHPSCMDLAEVSEVVRSYAWKCIECKSCEICHEKGDDARILFCDFCDRGWHMDCLPTPLEESPPGRWHCPTCPSLLPDDQYLEPSGPEMQFEMPRENSVASTSQLPNYQTKSTVDHILQELPLSAGSHDVNEEVMPSVKLKMKNWSKSNKKAKVRKVTEERDEEGQSPVQQIKRIRFRHNSPPPASLPRVRLRLPAQKGKGKEREEEESKKGVFDDILSSEDRDTTKTTIESSDKQRFEKSRLAAEEKLAPPPPPPPPPVPDELPTPGPSSRPLRSSALHHSSMPISTPASGPSASPAPSTSAPFAKASETPVQGLRIRTIRFGQFDIQTWFDAPFPEEYANIPDGRLWICEFCLKYMKSRFGAVRHRTKCKARHPPGDEIYRDGNVSIFEVDGRKNKIYCQNLCLLSKMFLDHKSLFYDVEPFLFYVMTEVDDVGARFVGYFSKEKRSPKDYNVSCIMTLPVRQRQGWGNLLIDFSYLLSKKEGRLGSPEKPLSGLGALGYKSYWTLALMRFLSTVPDEPPLRLEDISTTTSMTVEDVCTVLTQNGMLYTRDVTPPPVRPSPGQTIRYPKGRKNGIARRHLQRKQTKEEDTKQPFVTPTDYQISWDDEKVKQYLAAWESKGYLKLNPEKLKWSPFLLSRVKGGESQATSQTSASVAEGQTDGHTTSSKDDQLGGSLSMDATTSAVQALTLEEGMNQCLPSPSPSKVLRSGEGVGSERELTDVNTVPKRNLRNLSTPRSNLKIVEEDYAPDTPRLTRSRSTRSTKTSDDPFVEDTPVRPNELRRSRRSHTATDASSKRGISTTSNSKPPSPRKRRRVESSPEESTSLTKPVNGKARSDLKQSLRMRKVSHLVDESDTEQDTSVLTPVRSSTVEIWEDGFRKALLGGGNVAESNDVRNSSPEVKSEDSGTSLTSLTSGQLGSIINDELASPTDVNGLSVSPVIDRQVFEDLHPPQVTSCVKQSGEGAKEMNLDDGEDADADGEYEEDAEGEPDTEFLGTY